MTKFKSSSEILDTLEQTFGIGAYHEVQRDEGVVVICFYVDEDNDDLELSDYERGYLMAFYDNHAKPKMIVEGFTDPTSEETFWIGVQVGERMFDLAIYYDELGQQALTCVIYECKPTEDGENWVTDMSLGREVLF